MKYVVLDLTETAYGNGVKVVGTIDSEGIARIKAIDGHEVSRPDRKSGIIWLEESGNIIAVPTQPKNVPDYADVWIANCSND